MATPPLELAAGWLLGASRGYSPPKHIISRTMSVLGDGRNREREEETVGSMRHAGAVVLSAMNCGSRQNLWRLSPPHHGLLLASLAIGVHVPLLVAFSIPPTSRHPDLSRTPWRRRLVHPVLLLRHVCRRRHRRRRRLLDPFEIPQI